MERFEEVGWASNRSWVAHSIFVNDHEIASLGKWGTGICHCPSGNLRMSNAQVGSGLILPGDPAAMTTLAATTAAQVPVSARRTLRRFMATSLGRWLHAFRHNCESHIDAGDYS